MAGMEKFSWQGHCMYCGQCEENYPFGVAIINQMELAAGKFGY